MSHGPIASTGSSKSAASMLPARFVRANLIIALAEQLAGWGRQIEVLEPPELRRELARIGAELASMYSDG